MKQSEQVGRRTEWLKVADLRIDAPYQRKLDFGRAKRIADTFDIKQLTAIVVSRREDGTVWVLDGQHRVTVLREKGWEDMYVQCEVREDLTYEEEALLHVELNHNRVKPTALAEFNAMVEAKDAMHLDIIRVLEKHELAVSDEYNSHSVRAVSSLKSIYLHGGAKLLDNTLQVIIKSWGVAKDCWQTDILKAVAQVLSMYGNEMDQEKLVRALSKLRPAEYLRKGNAGREVNRANLTNNVTVAMVADYNSIPGGKKLKVPHDMLKAHAKTILPSGGKGGTWGAAGKKKLTVAQEQELVKKLKSKDYTYKQASEEYSVSTATITNIIRRWK